MISCGRPSESGVFLGVKQISEGLTFTSLQLPALETYKYNNRRGTLKSLESRM